MWFADRWPGFAISQGSNSGEPSLSSIYPYPARLLLLLLLLLLLPCRVLIHSFFAGESVRGAPRPSVLMVVMMMMLLMMIML